MNTDPAPTPSKLLLTWFDDTVHTVLQPLSSDLGENMRLEGVRRAMDELRELAHRPPQETRVCFLGTAGVGKSTLINVLVADHAYLVPEGSVGTLTAQAAQIRRTRTEERAFLRVSYDVARLQQLRLPLEQALKRTPQQSALDDPERTWREKIRLLVTGSQSSPRDDAYLLTALESALGNGPVDPSLAPQDVERVVRVRDAREAPALEATCTSSEPDDAFRVLVHDHVAGFMAPLVKTVEIGWPSEHLPDGLRVIDLPGIGIVRDGKADVTPQWVRKADAVVLVVRQRGLEEGPAQLLRDTGFLNGLLHHVGSTAPPPALFVVMTRIDEAAESAWTQERATQGKAKARSYSAQYASKRDEAVRLVREQARQALRYAARGDDEAFHDDAVDLLVGADPSAPDVGRRFRVFVTAATEHRKLLVNDEEDRPRLRAQEETGVDDLRRALFDLRQQRTQWERERERMSFERARAAVLAAIETWAELVQRPMVPREVLAELSQSPLREHQLELRQRLGTFQERLTGPEVVTAALEDALSASHRQVERVVRELKDLNVKTLQAAIDRGGVFQGTKKRVDLPQELTVACEPYFVEAWTGRILPRLREAVETYIQHMGQAVHRLKEWTTARMSGDARSLAHARLREVERWLVQVEATHAGAEERARERSRQQLQLVMTQAVNESCESFSENSGRGVRDRIVAHLSRELTDAVQTDIRNTAVNLLTGLRNEVVESVRKALLVHDPYEDLKNVLETAGQGPSAGGAARAMELRKLAESAPPAWAS